MYGMVIIDDEEIVIDGLTSVVDWEEHKINILGTATNGLHGLEIILQRKPDIVLTDIRMPGLDGFQLIEQVREELPNTIFVIISGHAEFNYAKSAIKLDVIDYLVKPVNVQDILLVIEKAIARSERAKIDSIDQYKQEMIHQQMFDVMLGMEMNNLMFANAENFYYFVVCLGFENQYALGDEKIEKVILKMKERLAVTNEHVYHYSLEQRFYFLVFNKKKQGLVKEDIYEIHSIIDNEMKQQTGLGIGRTYEGVTDVSCSYKESIVAFEWAFFWQRAYSFFNDINQVFIFQSEDYMKEMTMLFKRKSLDSQAIATWIDNLFLLLKETKPDPSEVKIISDTFIDHYSKYIEETYGVILKNILNAPFLSNSHLITISEYQIYLKEMVSRVSNVIKTKRINPRAKLIKEIKAYLNENYQQPIQLIDVAAEFDMNTSYLSHLFSKEVGMTISEYLLEIRMTHAKKLLRTTSYKIDKISNMVGYENSRYFHQVFKKYVDSTPSNYRKEHTIEI
ncbi:response regulator transcription factor [Gracilibacillus phocaeensis]|uniref:response regulator transcription factor n=1 Tax=Gracilibacillus phocaeensis TaxID=2042304 RepID=UPI0010302F63|nr:response regulator [Gracilibacillus phocaeensis]